ncbi:pantoate--beta-alanine ligase [Microbacterium sp. C7(2022)]|uniref:pantoate--beta-alanine ligase n=1 Tax=Microbacterium sp. C7(2022) TaxID=2992759 RepID=UPI00237AA153|nr:pantoate--beta-alanine ligase [Microbacterium sp. C7(2022)]MDE0545829.1 pantoate--beta-alanine ligase [Microbacterium sp. C7(2022)]
MSTDPAVAVIDTVEGLRTRMASQRAAGSRVALVPTMGALHEGHLALIRAAAADAEEVVVSVFVNPTQFTQASDLDTYPRDLDRDIELAASAGATTVFAPAVSQVYPEGFSTSVRIGGVTERWEGATRGAAHFDGVALVVTKLFGMVGPDTAWFGRKDAQQIAVVRRLVADLDLPVRIRTVETIRDHDGLALSSRNVRLRPKDRQRAVAVHASLQSARELVSSGETDAAQLAHAARQVLAQEGIEPEYWAVVDPQTFEELESVADGALAIVAAYVGDVRLIDNLVLS